MCMEFTGKNYTKKAQGLPRISTAYILPNCSREACSFFNIQTLTDYPPSSIVIIYGVSESQVP